MNRGDRLRVAVQKSGRLADPSLVLLAQCGLEFRQSRDKLFCYGETLPIAAVVSSSCCCGAWTARSR